MLGFVRLLNIFSRIIVLGLLLLFGCCVQFLNHTLLHIIRSINDTSYAKAYKKPQTNIKILAFPVNRSFVILTDIVYKPFGSQFPQFP